MHYIVEFFKIFFLEMAILGTAFMATYGNYKEIGANIYKAITTNKLMNMAASALYDYSKLKVKWQKYSDELYRSNAFVRFGVDLCDYSQRYVLSLCNSTKIEPFSSQWIDTIKLYEDPDNITVTVVNENKRRVQCGCDISENYYNNPDWPTERAIESYALEMAIHSVFSEKGDMEILMLLKTEDRRFSRIAWSPTPSRIVNARGNVTLPLESPPKGSDSNRQMCKRGPTEKTTVMISLHSSSVRFLTVEYCHPRMKTTLLLNLEREYYLEGNHLFSAAFICRTLKYQYSAKDYYFDTNYTLKLMDNDINMTELVCGQYVVLEKEGFRVAET
jgi:hypothetical protein